MPYSTTKLWDGEAAQIFEGSNDGTDTGLIASVSIAIVENQHEVKAGQTGEQILDLRRLSQHYVVVIAFQSSKDAAFFKKWWFEDRAATAGLTEIHNAGIGKSVPTKRIRLHPISMGDGTLDWTFERLAITNNAGLLFDGAGRKVENALTFMTLPDPTDVSGDLTLGEFGVSTA